MGDVKLYKFYQRFPDNSLHEIAPYPGAKIKFSVNNEWKTMTYLNGGWAFEDTIPQTSQFTDPALGEAQENRYDEWEHMVLMGVK